MTFEQAVDSLIELAKDLAEAEMELAQYERDTEAYSARTGKGRSARRFLPNAKRRVEWGRNRLDGARARVLQAGAP